MARRQLRDTVAQALVQHRHRVDCLNAGISECFIAKRQSNVAVPVRSINCGTRTSVPEHFSKILARSLDVKPFSFFAGMSRKYYIAENGIALPVRMRFSIVW